MKPLKTFRPHGGVRGANLSRSSLLFGGPFGRIFRAIPPADFGGTDQKTLTHLDHLAAAMLAKAEDAGPIDGPDPEESGIPAAYTYFGQFIDHDLTFDPASSLQKQNDPDALVDYRTPRFDLDNIYGRGPDDQPYMYDDKVFLLGEEMTGAAATNPRARDLPRSRGDNATPPGKGDRAIIGDPRNDENVIVSQLQGLWHRFHNKIVADHKGWSFEEVQEAVRFHYQWIVLNDFLPRIVAAEVLEDILPSGTGNLAMNPPKLKYFHTKNEAFMPLEFSAAAYRFGHSMVRPAYRLNDAVGKVPIFAFGENTIDLRGFKSPLPGWAIDWQRFVDLVPLDYGVPGVDPAPPDQTNPKNLNRLQLAYRIDTSLVNPLSTLPESIGSTMPSLARRNLERGWRMRLPSGQDIARAMGVAPIPDHEIKIGKYTGVDTLKPITDFGGGVFNDNCPLWTYCLAETRMHIKPVTIETSTGPKTIDTPQLGWVGGRIVAETFIGLLMADSSSYISQNPLWKPFLANPDGTFGLRDMVKYAPKGSGNSKALRSGGPCWL